MKKKLKAFSLIEVLVSTVILTIAVFGVFKFIGENEKILSNGLNNENINSLFPSFVECIENNYGNTNIGDDKTFYIGLKNCSVETSETGIILDDLEYILYGSGIGNNTIDLFIKTDKLSMQKIYNLKP